MGEAVARIDQDLVDGEVFDFMPGAEVTFEEGDSMHCFRCNGSMTSITAFIAARVSDLEAGRRIVRMFEPNAAYTGGQPKSPWVLVLSCEEKKCVQGLAYLRSRSKGSITSDMIRASQL